MTRLDFARAFYHEDRTRTFAFCRLSRVGVPPIKGKRFNRRSQINRSVVNRFADLHCFDLSFSFTCWRKICQISGVRGIVTLERKYAVEISVKLIS